MGLRHTKVGRSSRTQTKRFSLSTPSDLGGGVRFLDRARRQMERRRNEGGSLARWSLGRHRGGRLIGRRLADTLEPTRSGLGGKASHGDGDRRSGRVRGRPRLRVDRCLWLCFKESGFDSRRGRRGRADDRAVGLWRLHRAGSRQRRVDRDAARSRWASAQRRRTIRVAQNCRTAQPRWRGHAQPRRAWKSASTRRGPGGSG
jgi:hypothetical protein